MMSHKGKRWMQGGSPPGLMLTSLLDMFTIILIFLIVSFGEEDQNFQLNENLTLPESSAQSVFKPSVNLAITKEGIEVEKQKVATLTEGRAKPEDYEAGSIPTLVEPLRKIFARLDQVPSLQSDEGAVILIQADKELDYRTLYLVLQSASEAGFARYRLAILKK